MTGSPEEQVQVGCIVPALDLLLHHGQWLQLVTAETNNKHQRPISEFLVCSTAAYVCVSMPYLQLTAVLVSACSVLQLRCVQAPLWPSQDKHRLLSTVRW